MSSRSNAMHCGARVLSSLAHAVDLSGEAPLFKTGDSLYPGYVTETSLHEAPPPAGPEWMEDIDTWKEDKGPAVPITLRAGRGSPEFVESSASRPLLLPVRPMPSFSRGPHQSSRQLFTQEVRATIGSVVQKNLDQIKRKICKETTVRLMEKMPHEGWPDRVQDDQGYVGMLVMDQMDKKHNEMDRMQGVITQLQNENMRLKLKLEQEQARRKKRPAKVKVSKAKRLCHKAPRAPRQAAAYAVRRDLAVSPGFIGDKPLHAKRISKKPPSKDLF